MTECDEIADGIAIAPAVIKIMTMHEARRAVRAAVGADQIPSQQWLDNVAWALLQRARREGS